MEEENIDIRYFRFSSKNFGGFICKIKISDDTTIRSLENECLEYLMEVLLKYNFAKLIEKIMGKKFYIHAPLQDILKGPCSKIFYICDCPPHLEEI